MQCPCGCGRKVGFTKKGSAKAYPEAIEAAAFYQDVEASPWVQEGADPQTRSRLLAAAASASRLPGYFLEHLHGTARPGSTPDVMTLAQQLRANRQLADEIAASG